MWHAEVSSLVLRYFNEGMGYELHAEFNGVGFAKACGRGVMFLEGVLRTDGAQLSLNDWRELALLLRNDFGVEMIKSDRRGKEVSFPTARALRGAA